MVYLQRLAEIRSFLKSSSENHHPIDCLIVPRVDRYQGEFVHPCDERLVWLTGFTGSAGVALILQDRAALFVDGRYVLQAKQEVPNDLYNIIPIHQKSPQVFLEEYLKEHPEKSITISYDPWLHTLNDREKWLKMCGMNHCQLLGLPSNPIDNMWYNRPSRPMDPVQIHPPIFAGRSIKSKIQQAQQEMAKTGADAAILTNPHSICWLLNIRGTDFPYTPTIDCMAILYAPEKENADHPVELFIHPDKITQEVKDHLNEVVILKSEADLTDSLKKLSNLRVQIDPNQTPLWIIDKLPKDKYQKASDPCLLPKALKTKEEIEGIREAHVRDGVALTKFLSWLHQSWGHDEHPFLVNEISASEKLEEFRKEGEHYKGPSFATISAYGSNGAIVHYHSSPKTCKTIEGDSLFLLDSGGQYLDGTTDITRTICLGEPAQEQKRLFTLVLKGHIDLAMARFPKGTTGGQLDAIARLPLWQAGLDYDHGTGHGVGYYLGVHEGPQSISKAMIPIGLQPGMVLSNEPGYYREGEFGIRIESLVVVNEVTETFERPLLEFETLTVVPIDRKLIDESMLTAPEWTWLNNYHKRVRETLLPYLDPETATWLIEATQEI